LAIERIFYCDGPECETHIRTMAHRPATAFITATEQWPGRKATHHFCTWDCAMKCAVAKSPLEVVPWSDDESP
jgi:hypothetical protein